VIRRPVGQLGVHHDALRNWIRQAEADRGGRDDRPATAETKELSRLRNENAELCRANEISRRRALFAQELTRPGRSGEGRRATR
jgi:transposase